MKKRVNASRFAHLLPFLLILAALNLPLGFAQDEILNARSIRANIEVSSNIDIIPLGNDWRINRIIVEQSFYPREDWRQKVIGLKTDPYAAMNGSSLVYRWEPPKSSGVDFSASGEVNAKNGFVAVKNKITFPIKNIPNDIKQYISPQENIDSGNRMIIDKANELAKGEDDLYVVVFNVAEWVQNNIKYSLDTLTAEASQKASWVLTNKEGVCDEISSLFIGMLRSLGIPARYVSGVAYTNWNDIDDFGPHAWSEVYFPGYGWIPFDITYGEFGFIDAGHIKLKESIDSNEASVNYRWEGWLIDLKTHRLDIDTEILQIDDSIEPSLSMKAGMVKNNVKFGSYNLLEVELSNPADYYLPVDVSVSKSQGLDIIGPLRKQALLLPGETRKLYWILKVDEDLNSNFIYTFTMLAKSTSNAGSETSFTSTSRDQSYTLSYMQSLMAQKSEERQKIYSRNVSLSCKPDREYYYLDEFGAIQCEIINQGNTPLNNIDVCYLASCSRINLGISESASTKFFTNFTSPGLKSLDIIAKSSEITKTADTEVLILDPPSINITEITYPTTLEYGKSYSTEFTLKKASFSEPQDALVSLQTPIGKKEWSVANLSQDRRFSVNFLSSELDAGENEFMVKVGFSDMRGKSYTAEKLYTLSLDNLNFWQRLHTKFNYLSRKFSSLDLKLLVIAAFVFGIVIGIIFKKAKSRRLEAEQEIRAEKNYAEKEQGEVRTDIGKPSESPSAPKKTTAQKPNMQTKSSSKVQDSQRQKRKAL